MLWDDIFVRFSNNVSCLKLAIAQGLLTDNILVEYECVDELLRRYFWGFKGGVADVGKIPKKNGTTHWKLQFLTTTNLH
mgnify:FL=1